MHRAGPLLALLVCGNLVADVRAELSYRFFGRGTLDVNSTQGVAGESVEVTFVYRVSDFPGTSGPNPAASSWSPNRDIGLRAVGSISGDAFNLALLRRVGVAQFTKVQWQYDSGFGSGVLQSIGLAQAIPSSTSLTSPLPKSFAEAHGRFLQELPLGNWISWPRADIWGATHTDQHRDAITLTNYTWTITAIPEPTATVSLTASLFMLPLRRFRRECRRR
jgi:hypothetical protein